MADTKVNKSQAIRDYLEDNPGSTPKRIVEGLRSRGLEVSEGLAANVKSRAKSKGKRKKKVVKPAGKGRGVKSEAIREYMRENPGATPSQIHSGLKDRGIEVSQGLVSAVKYGGGGTTKSSKKQSNVGRPVSSAGNTLSAMDLIEAKKLVDKLGGARQVRQALDALEQLR